MAKRQTPSESKTKGTKETQSTSGAMSKPRASNRRKIAKKVSKRLVCPEDGNGNGQMPEKPMPKTRLKSEELELFKALLLEKRRQLLGDVDTMQDEALKRNRSDASGDLSMMPIHMADIGTDNYEQEFTIGLIESEQEILKEIDAALKRIENGTYGVCEGTHKPISKTRLKAKPWARFCINYKRSQEQNPRRSAF